MFEIIMATYTDSIKVKISEKYKPPPKISLITSYAQRLNLNKQVQNSIPNYDFSMEKYILEKMRELKENKLLTLKERQSNLEHKKQKLQAKKETIEDVGVITGDDSLPPPRNDVSQDMKYMMPDNTVLLPTQFSNCYSNILKPTQLQDYGKQMINKEIDKKSTFNLSDFEYDTSSPFDNMELKSINDLEELAQVLNKEENDHKINSKQVYPETSVAGNTNSTQLNYNDYMPSSYSANQYIQVPNSASSIGPNNEHYIYSNGYKYQVDYSQLNQQYQPSYAWTKLTNEYNPFQLANVEQRESSCKSVPDIVNALQMELENSHIADQSYNKSLEGVKTTVQECRPKSVDDVSLTHKKSQNEDSLLKSLSKNEQDLCRSISIMGFPMERVARVFRLLGNDEKKIIEHLLAMSDLLDLGFHEKDVSVALLECDNDRDKALDKLIT